MTIMYTIFATTIGLYGVVAADDWSYWGEHDPTHWPGLCMTGKKQSPINIVTESTIKTDLGALKFIRYDFAFSGKITNNGHSVQVQPYGVPIHLEGADLPTTYILEQMHFHWPAEHTMDNSRDLLELHFVHYNDQFDNVSLASQHGNGIAVIATLFELSSKDNPDIAPILKATESISSRVGMSTSLTGTKIIPYHLLPKDYTTYYRYDGSLTTPGCQESVIWFILTEKLTVSERQLNVLKRISSNNGTLGFNYRPTQALGERKVYHHLDGYSAASTHTSLLIYTCLSFILNRLLSSA